MNRALPMGVALNRRAKAEASMGIACGDVDRAARASLEAAGFGPPQRRCAAGRRATRGWNSSSAKASHSAR